MKISHNDEVSEINMTPLVDVMLVLLIIFMITMPAMTQTLSVKLPQAQAKPERSQQDTLTLNLQADGHIVLDQTHLDAEALHDTLTQAAQRNPQPALRIQADETLPYGKVAKVMSQAHTAGLEQIRFVFSQPPHFSSTTPASTRQPE